MKRFLRSHGLAAACSVAFVGVVTAGYFSSAGVPGLYFCDGRPMTLAQVAAHRGTDTDTIDQLHRQRSLDVAQVCSMPEAKLRRAIYRVHNPMPDHPGEWAKQRRMTMQDENGNVPFDGLTKAHEHVRAMQEAQGATPDQISKTSWTWIGPAGVGGRIRSILVDPTTPTTMYVGSVSGGIWKSTNSGASWKILTDFMANMAVSTMVMDPTNPSIIYAGTGEGFFNEDRILGNGIFKSTNAGATWKQLASTNNANFAIVNRLAISPNDGVILAAVGGINTTDGGIYRSANGGVSWVKALSARTLDLAFHPTNSLRAIASGDSGQTWYSTDSGKTWHASSGINTTGGFNNRVEIAYAKSNGNVVYASSGYNNGTLYRSSDGGKTFTQVNTGNFYLGSQAWYGDALWVDPTNPAVVVVGGIDLWRSTNSGSTLTKISQWQSAPTLSAHADHHAIVAHPNYNGTTNRTVFFGNDGGIYEAANVRTVSLTSGWTNLNNNIGITQFYGAAGHIASGRITGGTQDNGSLFYSGSTTWSTTFGGDGGFAAAVPGGASPTNFFGEYVYLQIHRSNNGAAANYIYSGITDANSCALFIAPFILDPNNPNTMLAGGCSLWRSTNVNSATPTWTQIKGAGTGQISAIAAEPGNSAVIWVGYTNGDVYRTTNGTAATPSWTKVDGTSLPGRYVTRIAIQKSNPKVVYVTFGGFFDGYTTGNIWKTTNGTAATPTWTNVHGSGSTGLPAVPVRSIVIHPRNASVIYVGTDSGIFVSSTGGGTWTVPQSGPTNTAVDELFFMGTTLYAATHGRGVFKSPTLPVPQPPGPVAAATSEPSVEIEATAPPTPASDPGGTPATAAAAPGVDDDD